MKSFTCPQISELSGPPPTAHPTLRLLLGPSGAPKPESSLSSPQPCPQLPAPAPHPVSSPQTPGECLPHGRTPH